MEPDQLLIKTPSLSEEEVQAAAHIQELERRIAVLLAEGGEWLPGLRRLALARSVRASCAIDGTVAALDEVLAIGQGHEPLEVSPASRGVVQGCWDAMVYTIQLAREEPEISQLTLRTVHFLLEKAERGGRPGHFRTAASPVRLLHPGSLAYPGAPAHQLSSLVGELVDSLPLPGDSGPMRAAMAHLNLVLVRPFARGNGRAARCLHALLLDREGALPAVFASADEFLGRSAAAYRAALAEAGGLQWNPGLDARPWARFCLQAQYQQARTTLWRLGEAELLWTAVRGLAANYGLPPRVAAPLGDAAHGVRLRNPLYRSAVMETDGNEIEVHTASRDLRALAEAGLLEPRGVTRARTYGPSRMLLRLQEEVRNSLPRPETVQLLGQQPLAALPG